MNLTTYEAGMIFRPIIYFAALFALCVLFRLALHGIILAMRYADDREEKRIRDRSVKESIKEMRRYAVTELPALRSTLYRTTPRPMPKRVDHAPSTGGHEMRNRDDGGSGFIPGLAVGLLMSGSSAPSAPSSAPSCGGGTETDGGSGGGDSGGGDGGSCGGGK